MDLGKIILFQQAQKKYLLMSIKELLIDVQNYDFRPIENSSLIDAGDIYDNFELEYSYDGRMPDLGAYEYNGEHWIPGITWDVIQEFGENFIPPEDINLLGDINNDGNIDVLDIIELVNIILYSIPDESADINSDGDIDILDAIQLVNIVLSS